MKAPYLIFALLLFCLQFSAQTYDIKRMWTSPYVLQAHDASFSFQIEMEDNLLDSIHAIVNTLGPPFPLGDPTFSQAGKFSDRIVFLDDGLNDDVVANDGIYTASQLKSFLADDDDDIAIPTSYFLKMKELNFYAGASSVSESSNANFQVRCFKAAATPQIKHVNPNFQHTSHVVNIVDEDLEYEEYNVHEAYESYYNHLPDDRHSILVVSTEISKNTQTFSGKSFRVANDVEGIGLSIFDYSEIHHSDGVLEQCIVLSNGAEDGGVVLHELHHRWGVRMPTEFQMSLGGHWLRTFELNGGGPTDIVDRIVANGDSTYNVYYNEARNWNAFHAVDMYLAGYGSVDDIQFPIKVILNATILGSDTDGSIIMHSPHELLYITKDLFVEKLGTRSPDYLNARREQRVAMMVRSQRLLTPDELAYFHKIMVEHEKTENSIFSPYTYFDLCQGEGKLNTRIYDFSSGIEDDLPITNTFKIFPNPASTQLTIESLSDHNSTIQSGQIINSTGKVMLDFEFKNKSTIDIHSLNAGVYFVKIKIEDAWYTQEFVKVE